MLKTFQSRDIHSLEDKINEWVLNHPNYIILLTQFEIGTLENDECHYAYIWYYKKEDD